MEQPEVKAPTPSLTARAALKERALDRWENEGGEIPSVPTPKTEGGTAANTRIDPQITEKANLPNPMPTRSKKPGRKTPSADAKIAAEAKSTAGNLTAQRIAATGRTTRVQGHVSAHNRRTQGKRDSRG